MQVDSYTKTALTVIAVCLVLLTFKEYEIVSDAEAGAPMSVNIVSLQGKPIWGNFLPVGITKVGNSTVSRSVPVVIKKK
jgi:hypothetical protein